MAKKYLITTAIDYTNDVVHIGHLYQKVLADLYARYRREVVGKKNVRFLTGTDEHGQNIENSAKKAGVTAKEYVDKISKLDIKEQDLLNISYDRFIRTTDKDHKEIVNEFFKIVFDAGHIYKSKYTGFYCEGCEAYKTKKDLIKDKCEYHPTKEIKEISEENYFFKWSSFQKFLEDFFDKNKKFVVPQKNFNEMENFLKSGLKDIPISRPNLTWGIPVPIDNKQVIYVWFDALINYYTYGAKQKFWDEDTEIIHFLGKDNARWHSLLWPAMLKAAGKRLPDTIYVNAFLSLNGQKISKSIGNVIKGSELVEKYGADPVRYYLLKYGPLIEDSDISLEKLNDVYVSELANNLGNLISRTTKLLEGYSGNKKIKPSEKISTNIYKHFENFRPDLAAQDIQIELSKLNTYVQDKKPWDKEENEKFEIVAKIIPDILEINKLLSFFIPETTEKISKIFENTPITPSKPLFPKI